MWTLQRLADYMAEQTGIRVSIDTVRQVLKAGEVVLSRPQHKVRSPDPAYLENTRRSQRPVMDESQTTCCTRLMGSTSVGCRRCARCGAEKDGKS
jgi:hypothetical protein